MPPKNEMQEREEWRMCDTVNRNAGCYTAAVYARKLRVEIIVNGERKACPLEWLDAFCMRNFTGSAEFDDTLPIAEGQIEASLRVDPSHFAHAFQEWLTKRGKGNGQPVTVEIQPEPSRS
jgi:hypothetical protein